MNIKFLGAAGTVTGSSYVVTSDSHQSILIDLGMFQGIAPIDSLNYEPFAFDAATISGAILTHAHLDHCGRLPILLPLGFVGNIWMTPATADLTELSLYDSAKIAKHDRKPFLYDQNIVAETIDRCKRILYQKSFTIGDFSITMRDAGHILGSASLEIVETKTNKKIVFSGDLGNSPEDLMQATELIESADIVVMESTYGDRLHPKGEPIDILQSEIQQVENSGGTLLIPAFSLERTQELLHMIKHLKESAKIKIGTPVILDSPMAIKATQIYKKYPALFNAHIQEDLKQGDPFSFPGLATIQKNKKNNPDTANGSKIIIAGSGMMMGGKIVGHAKHFLPIPTTRLLIVGYQAEETLGRALLEGNRVVTIDGQTVRVQATIQNTTSMSSHADQAQLLSWLGAIKNVKKVFLTHGEDEPRKNLAQKITEKLAIKDVVMPNRNDTAAC